MIGSESHVFQVGVTRLQVDPPVRWQIQVHDCSLADLHHVLQRLMGLGNSQLYRFDVGDVPFGPANVESELVFEDVNSMSVGDLLEFGFGKFKYVHDNGSRLEHSIVVETRHPESVRAVDSSRATLLG